MANRDEPIKPDELRKRLPKVGDKLVRTLECGRTFGLGDPKPQPCVVTYVNEKNLWYEVEFPTGIRHSYKMF